MDGGWSGGTAAVTTTKKICDIAPVPSHEETPAAARKEDYSARITANDLSFAGITAYDDGAEKRKTSH